MRRAPCVFLCAFSCQSPRADPATHAAASQRAAHSATVDVGVATSAEQRRDSSAIDGEALSSRDVNVRRIAARALARIADARAAELLPLALADEDAQVSTWGAYGLGYACRGREAQVAHSLVSRAASLGNLTEANATTTGLVSPIEAISDALGRCAGSEAESTLRAWLNGPEPRAAAAGLALGRLVEHAGKLDDASSVALLNAADRTPSTVQTALYPFTRLSSLNASTAERVTALALAAIAAHGPSAEFGLRALSHTGDSGSSALGKLLTDATLAPGLRAEAARELSTLGGRGQRALWNAFEQALPRAAGDAELSGAGYGPFSSMLDALQLPSFDTASQLQGLAELASNAEEAPSLKRRKMHVRCTAAGLLAGSNYRDARLLACDPGAESRGRDLAVLGALGREKLRGSRKQAYLRLAGATDTTLREAAVELLTQHAELPEAYRVLAGALSAKALGVVASAARVLARYPERASRIGEADVDAHVAPKPDPSVVQALGPAYAAAREQNSVEVQSLLLDAIGALQVLSSKETANAACRSDNVTLREHAENALHLLGEQGRRCDVFTPDERAPTNRVAVGKTLLTLETDAGTLTIALDPTFAPNAVARVVSLAQAGFYDGMTVHRVVPGFVAQFGDPSGDGYGGDGKPPLRCETSPMPFLEGGVGIALSGRDTGSSQMFVTLGRYPSLDGQYAWIGQAGPGWELLTAGDRILHATVSALL